MRNLLTTALDPDLLLEAYARGFFPMAESKDGPISWFSPDPRAVLPLERFNLPRSLARVVRSGNFEVRVDTAFDEVIRACAHREETWISPAIVDAYAELHRRGRAHSVESWREGKLAGGLYGVAIGGAFFGESMFSRVPNASKVALAALVDRLRNRGFALLDTQFVNPHLLQFGVEEISRARYLRLLAAAVRRPVTFAD